MDWRADLVARLRDLRPAGVCALDAAARTLAAEALPDTPVAGEDAPTGCTLALGVDMLDGLDAQAAEQRINRARLYVAPRMLIVAHADCALDEAAFRALGFDLAALDETTRVKVYHYDIDTYKTVPDWLNARFWAHPEQWEP